MDLNRMVAAAATFSATLDAAKATVADIDWYPYDSLANFTHLANSFKGKGRRIFETTQSLRVADIGVADGATSFFLESLSAAVTIIDNVSTNGNGCRGIKALTGALDSRVGLIEADLDFTTSIPGHYDFAMFLGILYHLRNPILVLSALAQSVSRMVVSTIVCSKLPRSSPIVALGDPSIEDEQMTFLLPARAYNNDPTNYWIMTPTSLRTVLKRSGWTILDEFRVGDVGTSRPGEGDQRMFCYCERHPNWASLRLHHDF